MGTIAGVGSGLQAALLLARGRAEGMVLLAAGDEPAMAVAARSFWAAALCLPAFICLLLIDLAQEPRLPPHAAHGLALQLLGYGVHWAGFALLTWWISGLIGRTAAWPRFIAAWNWCNVVQFLLLVVASLPPLLGMPAMVGETAWLVAAGWALWLEWYAARLALAVPGLTAAGLVSLDVALDLLRTGVIDSLPGSLTAGGG